MATIEGMNFNVSQPYAEGQTISALEARVLNQVRTKNVSNLVRETVKGMKDGGKSEQEITDYVLSIDNGYEFSAGRTARTVDPVETEAMKIAREQLKYHLSNSGRKLSTVPEGLTEEQWKEKVSAEIKRIASLEDIRKAAKKNVDAKAKQAAALAESLETVSI